VNPYVPVPTALPYSPFGALGAYPTDQAALLNYAQQARAMAFLAGANQPETLLDALRRRDAAQANLSQHAFGGHASRTPSGDDLPRLGAGGSRLGALWLRVRLLFVDTRNRRRPVAPLLLRSGALWRVA